ncbi:MAG: hypothetical protein AAGA77_18820 [Bacteroidota bacterium]
MKRIHLFEFEDFKWFPDFIRDGGTDFLGFILNITKFYAPAIPIMEKLIHSTGHKHILDLCSGNGGPVEFIHQRINPSLNLQFIVSDKYPNFPAYQQLKKRTNNQVDYYPHSLDILHPDAEVTGIRTLFSAIHHFKPTEVKTIVQNVIDSKMPVCIFDSGDKHFGTILLILIFHPILFLLFTPFIRPFKLRRILFTYLIPLIPVYTIWDGVISILRLYQPKELFEIAKTSDKNELYEWNYGKVKNSIGMSVAYLTGIPKQK